MLASHKWLTELAGFSLDSETLAQKLTSAGLEVESVTRHGEGLEPVVVAEVCQIRPHPQRDKLRLVEVFDGQQRSEVVCGAPNVPEPGGRVVLAQLGASLPGGITIAERKLAGVVSCGMLCSESELGIGSDQDGIVVLQDIDARPGTPIADALDLRDVVYEIGLTPNRPDCLGHLGLARDLCAIEGKSFAPPAVPAPGRLLSAPTDQFPQGDAVFKLSNLWSGNCASDGEAVGFAPVRVDIRDPSRCLRYGAALVSGVAIAPSPFATRYRLHVLGHRAINNVVDATNLILLGFGHPIHAFDYDRLEGSRIEVRLAQSGEKMTTLDGEPRSLSEDDLLICDGGRPVALAGVMGGGNSEIHDGTERVLIECAYFDPRSIRRTSKRTALHTDSSHRFERGVDPAAVPAVLAHSASLVARCAGGQLIEQGLDVNPTPVSRAKVGLRLGRVETLLGLGLEAGEVKRILTALGCELSERPDGFDVLCPTHRPDMVREVDLIEELARVHGYEHIPTAVPSVRPSQRGTSPEVLMVRQLRERAAAAGLQESVNFAFVAPSELMDARLPTEAAVLANPMSEERSVLRTGLLAGLAANLRLAQRHQLQRFAQFEVGRVFLPQAGQDLPHEAYELGVMVWGQRALWYDERDTMDFFDLKGVLEATLRPLVGSHVTTVPEPELDGSAPYLHPKRCAALRLGQETLGHLGELHPDVVDALELTGRPLYGLVRIPDLVRLVEDSASPQASDLPRFPASIRDVSVVVDEGVQAGEVASQLSQAGGALVTEVRLFDIYRGKPVPAGSKSLAFHVVYRDPMSTLTDKAVDKVHTKVTRAAEQYFGASVRK